MQVQLGVVDEVNREVPHYSVLVHTEAVSLAVSSNVSFSTANYLVVMNKLSNDPN